MDKGRPWSGLLFLDYHFLIYFLPWLKLPKQDQIEQCRFYLMLENKSTLDPKEIIEFLCDQRIFGTSKN